MSLRLKSVDHPECRPPSNLRRKKRTVVDAVNTLYLLLRIDPCCMDTVHHPTSLILFTRRERTSAINSKIVNTPQKKLDFHIIVNKSRRPDKRATMYFSFFASSIGHFVLFFFVSLFDCLFLAIAIHVIDKG